MKQTKELSSYTVLSGKYTYYRADVFAACLIEAGISPEQIVISRRSGLGQGFLYDIERVSVKYPYLYPESPFLNIESGRAGIYDSLPEGLFYVPDHSKGERDKAHIIDRMRMDKQAELAVRRLLSFFEVEADSFLCSIRTEELKYDKNHTYRKFVAVFEKHWEIIVLMSIPEALRFFKMIPHLASMRGDYNRMANVLSFILHIPVAVRRGVGYMKTNTDCFPSLSEMVLGDNSVLAPDEDEKPISTVLITISDMDMKSCTDFFDGENRERVLRYLAELFLEANTCIEIEIIPNAECREFIISDPGQDAYLGINTYL